MGCGRVAAHAKSVTQLAVLFLALTGSEHGFFENVTFDAETLAFR